MATRLQPDVRRDELLEIALDIAQVIGVQAMTRDRVAAAAGVSPGLISARFGTMLTLRESVEQEAHRRGIHLAAIGRHHPGRGERLWMTGKIGATTFRIIVTGTMGPHEAKLLARQIVDSAGAE